jgi:hypothetical protein
LSVSAQAGVLAPGEQRAGDDFILNLDDPSFDGETLATRTTPFEVLRADTETGETIGVTGAVTSAVIRESATGRLAFHYSVTGTEVGATVDFENFFVTGFSGFATDVFSSETSLTSGRATRSADGDEIDFVGDESWGADFVVRTDATAFEEGGGARILASYQTGSPEGGSDAFPSVDAFRPAADGPGPVPIPLPPALWAGLATMGTFGALRIARRR